MLMVNTHEAKTNLSKLLNLVIEKHETIRICRNGKVVADLVETGKEVKDRLKKNKKLSGVVFNEDPTAPLGDEFLPEAMLMEERSKYNASS